MAEKIVNDLTRGMIRKINPLKKEQNFYNFALNISTDKNRLDRITKVSERALEDYFNLKGVPYVILNTLYLNIDEYVFFITNKTGSFSEILYYNKGQITTKYNNSQLNFNPAYIISSTYRVSYNGDRLIYFVDGYNKDRVINLDKIQLTDDIESISINPIYDHSSSLNYTINYLGGNLPSGKYYIFVESLDINGKSSQFKYLIDGIPIENGNYKEELSKSSITSYSEYNEFVQESQDFNEVYGLLENTTTSKSISLDLSNVNSNYSTVNIYVILKQDTDYTIYTLENRTITDSVVISSLSDLTLLDGDISSILVSNIIYNKSETIAQKDNRLLLANTQLETYDYDFQQIANNVTVKPLLRREVFNSTERIPNRWYTGTSYNTNSASMNSTDNEKNIFSTPYYLAKTQKATLEAKTFMRDEVYALGMYFELSNGVFTDVYHIPGRKANDIPPNIIGNDPMDETGRVLNSSTAANWDTQLVTLEGTTDEYWKLYNTGVQGMLGYYRCDSVYPDNYGFPTDGEQNNQGKSYVRHHRIPSEYVYNTFNYNNFSSTNQQVLIKNLINLEFNNINIPQELQSVVRKVHFCIADRTENNKKVLSKGVLYANRVLPDGTIRNSEVLNAPVSYNNSTKSNTYFEFKSPEVDFLFKNSNIKGSYIKPTNVLVGYINHMVKGLTAPNLTNVPIPGAYTNYEGINRSTTDMDNIIYDYKQEVVLNRVNYRSFIPSRVDSESVKQYGINDIIFIDNNSVTSFAGNTIRYEGNQNSSILKLNNDYSPGVFGLIELEDLFRKIPSEYRSHGTVNNLFRNFFFEDQENRSNDYTDEERDVANKIFYDSTLYATILSNNTNIFGDILNIRYSRIVDDNRAIQGDSFIENHFSKKSYSTTVDVPNYNTVKSDYRYKDKVASIITVPPDGELRKENNLDISVSESYISFPVETRLNIRLRRHDGDNNHFPYNTMTASYPVNELEKKVLSQEVYTLDRKYHNENSINPLFPNTIKLSDLSNLNRKIGHRIIYSQLQNNESNIDNFRNFLANNYKDIITTKGNINKLFIKDNNLYILTRDSIFRINSSNNYLTTRDGSEIYVGTGEFLGVEPEELITLETGYAGTSSKLSTNENKFGYVFIDIIRNKIILFNQNLNDLNIVGLEEDLTINLFKYFPELNDNQLDKPLLGYGVLTGFDPETDRLIVTKLDYKPTELMLSEYNSDVITIREGLFYKDNNLLDFSNKDYFENKSFTVSYDCINSIWISYHNYFPKYYIPHSNILVIKDDNSIKKYGNNYTDKFILDVSFNEHQGLVKVFDSFQFDINTESVNEEFVEEFFDGLIAYSDNQCTGLITLNPNYPNNNITKKETYWNFSKLLDITDDKLNKKLFLSDWDSIKSNYYIDKILNINDLDTMKDWYKKKRFRGKYINLRLLKENINNRKFTINFGILNYRRSVR